MSLTPPGRNAEPAPISGASDKSAQPYGHRPRREIGPIALGEATPSGKATMYNVKKEKLFGSLDGGQEKKPITMRQ